MKLRCFSYICLDVLINVYIGSSNRFERSKLQGIPHEIPFYSKDTGGKVSYWYFISCYIKFVTKEMMTGSPYPIVIRVYNV